MTEAKVGVFYLCQVLVMTNCLLLKADYLFQQHIPLGVCL